MKKLFALSALTLASFASQADVRINGFANLVGGITSSDKSLYDYTDKMSFSEESAFAIQVSGDINSKMTATGQIVARGEDDYSPEFSWAYITYEATDKLSVSAGRIRLPVFKYSASLEVGYSYHWITPPQSVYDVTFNNIEGLRLDYSNYAGDWEYNVQLAYGTFKDEIGGGISTGKDTVVGTVEVQRDWFKARAVAGRATSTFEQTVIDGYADTLASVSPALGDSFRFKDDAGQFYGLSFEVDTFDYFAIAEFTRNINRDTFLADEDDFYFSVGMRTGKFTPSLTYEKSDRSSDIKFLDQVAALPAALQPSIGGLVTAVQQSFFREFNVITLGVRYDYDTNIALKADFSKYDRDDINVKEKVNLMRVALSYVF